MQASAALVVASALSRSQTVSVLLPSMEYSIERRSQELTLTSMPSVTRHLGHFLSAVRTVRATVSLRF